MSHIPASAMPHAKPHEEGHDAGAAPEQAAAAVPSTQAPATPASVPAPEPAATVAAEPRHDAPPGVPPAGPGKRPGPGGGAPIAAIATVAAIALGGIIAALAFRRPAPKADEPRAHGEKHDGGKAGRDRPKGRPRKAKPAE